MPEVPEARDVLDAAFFRDWLTAAAALVDREAERLTELDSPIGDADHGSNLQRGFTAVVEVLEKEAPSTPGAVLALAGRQLISTVGGASGPLYGTLLRRTGKALGAAGGDTGANADADADADANGEAVGVSREEFARALRVGVDAVSALGGATPGDKTMLDALVPGVDALTESFAAARDAAEEGALATTPLQARKGRASYLGERSIGHQDPGATSAALLFAALAETGGAGARGGEK
ncbi:dihydroxyacetone kinase subunit DhaL [Streptomyces sp. NPDC059009]|uniref:dihydroxyacetone kinase subunit DhaL n=1 Tax=Streptomyces sp. NPDC059009 TaxID=3346694 RepID=UPI0036CB9696